MACQEFAIQYDIYSFALDKSFLQRKVNLLPRRKLAPVEVGLSRGGTQTGALARASALFQLGVKLALAWSVENLLLQQIEATRLLFRGIHQGACLGVCHRPTTV